MSSPNWGALYRLEKIQYSSESALWLLHARGCGGNRWALSFGSLGRAIARYYLEPVQLSRPTGSPCDENFDPDYLPLLTCLFNNIVLLLKNLQFVVSWKIIHILHGEITNFFWTFHNGRIFIWEGNSSVIQRQGRTQGGELGLKPPVELDILRKCY